MFPYRNPELPGQPHWGRRSVRIPVQNQLRGGVGAPEPAGHLGLGPLDGFVSVDGRKLTHGTGSGHNRRRDQVQITVRREVYGQTSGPNRNLRQFLGVAEMAISQGVGLRGNQGQLGIRVLQLKRRALTRQKRSDHCRRLRLGPLGLCLHRAGHHRLTHALDLPRCPIVRRRHPPRWLSVGARVLDGVCRRHLACPTLS